MKKIPTLFERVYENHEMVERTFDGVKQYFKENYIEGIVFWKDAEPK